MINKTINIKKRFDELTDLISKPEIIADQKEWKKLVKERASLEDLANAHDELVKLQKELSEAEVTLKTETNEEMIDLFKEEVKDCKQKIDKLEEKIKILLLPKDENDDSNVIIEIRPGVGGEESALFGAVLMKMYMRYAERKKWKVEIADYSETEMGGVKECSFIISGKGAYSKLKYESGVHRVQRVPETESQGRVHTSTATVAVLPEVEDVDFEILDKDIRIDTYRSSGAGGQHVNKTDSAIRITHMPTGIVVACQDERSQIKNRERAFQILKSKLYDYYKSQRDKEYSENRKSQVGNAERCERIRTYNYPQGRITDHRINYTIYSLDDFLDGNIDEMIENLALADQKAKLELALNGNA
ncbi:MAG: peptide chain release factor 1 [Firmicutes bacterium]|nr:peptide chain release factor 1 [Bacillota bacterium]MDY3659010.1 peptide chain release factor 1 [Eubacteriales bacterium]